MRRWIPFFALLMALLLYDCTKSPDFKLVTLPDIEESYEAGPLTQDFLVGTVWTQCRQYRYEKGGWVKISGGDGWYCSTVTFQTDGNVRYEAHSDDMVDYYSSYHYETIPESHLLIQDGKTYVTYPMSEQAFLLRLDNQLYIYER